MYAKELREKLARLASDMRALVNKAKTDNNRGLTPEEASQFDRMEADYSALEASITRAEKTDKIEASLAAIPGSNVGQGTGTGNSPAGAQDQYARAFSNYLRGGIDALNADDIRLMSARINNTMSTTTGSQGGYTIPQEFLKLLTDAMLWFGGAEDGVETITTDTGAPLLMPTDNDTTNIGEIVGQNTAVTSQDADNFGQLILNAYIFSSKLVKVPLALIQDSAFSIDAYLAKKLGTRIGRILNRKLTIGTGTNEPTGLVTAAYAAGNVFTPATGNATSVTPDSLTELEHSVDPSYRNNPSAKFMFHDSTLKALKKLKDNNLRPLWSPALSGTLGSGAGATINDHGFIVNNDMPVMAASNKSILFGDLSAYKCRKVTGDITVKRLVERYAESLQVGYLAFMRADGNLLDAGTHPVAVYVNSAS